jgi:hypothetical protein
LSFRGGGGKDELNLTEEEIEAVCRDLNEDMPEILAALGLPHGAPVSPPEVGIFYTLN